MTDKQQNERMQAMLEFESTQPVKRFWLSFVDPTKAKGQRFLGVAIVNAGGILSASVVAHSLGCNPGGEMACTELDPKMVIPDKYMERLLTKKEIDLLNKTQVN